MHPVGKGPGVVLQRWHAQFERPAKDRPIIESAHIPIPQLNAQIDLAVKQHLKANVESRKVAANGMTTEELTQAMSRLVDHVKVNTESIDEVRQSMASTAGRLSAVEAKVFKHK